MSDSSYIRFTGEDSADAASPPSGKFKLKIGEDGIPYVINSSGVITSFGGGIEALGWVAITDTTYTSGSPFTISSGVDTVLRFNNDSILESFAPSGYTAVDFFDDTNYRINSPQVGFAYDFRLSFKCVPSANSRQLVTSYSIGTGLGSQIVIDQRSSELRISGSPSYISMTSLIYSLDTFIANGMEIILNANTNCDIYDIGMVINRTS